MLQNNSSSFSNKIGRNTQFYKTMKINSLGCGFWHAKYHPLPCVVAHKVPNMPALVGVFTDNPLTINQLQKR